MAHYSAPENRVQDEREAVLGWTQEQLAHFAQQQGHQLSTKTIGRLEAGTRFYSRVTFTRVHAAINGARQRINKPEISFADLFPRFLPVRRPPKSQYHNPASTDAESA
jgi:hypothetical protein